jgi:SAM-dependent methyltransferase
MAATSSSAGYGASDVPYLRSFVKETAPAHLDHVASLSGVAPPDRRGGFTWCDLGCGQGVTAVMLAAMHPRGEFHGIDMMPAHIDHARRLAMEAIVPNASFHAADFNAADELDLPQFDYIVAHGVYTWVSPHVRGEMRAFIDRRLKPGGLVYLSYNALPGRAADLPMQRLVRAFSEARIGSSTERVGGALQIANLLRTLNVVPLAASPMLDRVNELNEDGAAAYVAHELLARHWEPLCVTEVRCDLATIGLDPVGTATLLENYDTFVVPAAARSMLAHIVDRDLRELARDFLIDQSFRRDVFVRGAQRLSADDQRRAMLRCAFGLTRQPSRIAYAVAAPAGRVAFDTPAARKIVGALASGPRVLGEVAQECDIAPADALASALTLCACGQMQPTEAASAPVTAFNAAVLSRLNGAEEIGYLATPFGSSILINNAVRENLTKCQPSRAEPSWQNYLAVHGLASIFPSDGRR